MKIVRGSKEDHLFFMDKLGQDKEVWVAAHLLGKRRRPARETSDAWHLRAFVACRRQEVVELAVWSCTKQAQLAFEEYNATSLTWSELYDKGYRWKITGKLLYPKNPEGLLAQLREHKKCCNRHSICLLRT